MIFLLISIVCNTLLFIILKYYPRFKIDTFQAIVVNYFTAACLGFITSSIDLNINDSHQQNWILISVILGTIFISTFVLIAKTAQELGVSVASVANKMSVIIPVVLAIYLYNDRLNVIKVSGIILALLAVYLTSKKENSATFQAKDSKLFLLPLIVFIGSGIIDGLVNYGQQRLLLEEESALFVSAGFLTAGCIGTVVIIWKLLFSKEKFQLKNILAGIALGIPNYFSLYGMVKALNAIRMESSILYPINNMAVVALSAISSYILFKENFSKSNKTGIILSIIAIIMITFS